MKGVLSASFAPDGRSFVATAANGFAGICDLAGEIVYAFEKQAGPVEHGVFSHDGKLVALTVGRKVRLYDTDGTLHGELVGHEGRITDASFSRDGTRILTSSEDKTARLWRVDGSEQAVLRGHDAAVLSAVFASSGDRILTASADRTARLWSGKGEPLAILRGHEGRVTTAGFTEQGRTVITAAEDGTVRLWVADAEDLMLLADRRALRAFTEEERLRYGELLGEAR